MTRTSIVFLTATVLGLSGCVETTPVNTVDGPCETGTFVGAFDGETLLPQNWTCQERQEFWFTDQGSQIIPYSWFLYLEQPDSTAKFADPANMDRYRYLPQSQTTLNPDSLPIGFTMGSAKNNRAYKDISGEWLGMTCAACHTGQVEFGGAKYLIDGAPSMADFEGMFIDLALALSRTHRDDQKFQRFADLVIAENKSRGTGTTDPETLRRELADLARIRTEWNTRNAGTAESGPYGHARLDALGAIFNEVAATAFDAPQNVRPANAPVSYPFLWDTPQHDKVQWNGSVANAGLGSLARNVGEVLGVFGALEIRGRRLIPIGHASSVDVKGLGRLEELAWKLQSPLWADTDLPAIDLAKAARGKADFDRFCVSCHQPIDRADPNRRVKAVMVPISDPENPSDPNALGTDPTTALNFIEPEARRDGSALTGRYKRYLRRLSDNQKFTKATEDATPAASMLGFAVSGTIINLLISDPRETIRALKVGQPEENARKVDAADRLSGEEIEVAEAGAFAAEVSAEVPPAFSAPEGRACVPEGSLACYKARPLNGIWATAPYLHNGSVRTMRELLLPVEQRDKTFRVGSREFDPDAIGFANDGAFVLDTSRPGNSNAGHDGPDYGNDELASDPDRLDALLEYLKTL
jgi:cytochrome c5